MADQGDAIVIDFRDIGLAITRKVCARVSIAVASLGLLNKEPQSISAMFLGRSNADGQLSKNSFFAAVEGFSGFPMARMDVSTRRLMTDFFDSFNRNGNGNVDAVELSCGFCLLCGG